MLRLLTLCSLLMVGMSALAADMPEFQLTIRNQSFDPVQLKVPANTKFKLLVKNTDSTPSEFESTDMNREKIVLPNSTINVYIGPLDKGSYKFFDDFHQDTGKGVLIAE
ncbi:MAG: cupredoxin domain-containing protein [Proteobacteria bacterium]|nr:cupredoxin domain-containing protein [Pseudomonadota bacterium]